ncbi:hypothetical protein BGZ97_006112 [Linnemannia gamsii]|uniref:RNI-like protein n=1 Tax=Linnemannia gamsii TaxID=64522 RepID=A0A9P6QS08_9FUNG|nr:hypothetical protein BGZ97_006112 [Linnemannia gamsii]
MLDSLALAEKLHRLQDLVLECWRLDQGFVELLRSNPGLRTLALDFVTGEALPPPPPPPPSLEEGLLMTGWEGGGGGGGVGNSSTATMVSSSSSWSSSSYMSSLLNIPSSASSNGAYTQAKSPTITTPTTTVTGRYPPEWHDEDNDSYHHHHHYYNHHPYSPKQKNPNPYGFQLLHLTCLSVCKDVESGAFETLIRLCPNLEELSWMGPLDSDLEELTINLAECCPRVAVLTYSTVDVSEPEHRYAALVRSLPALVDLQIRIPTLEGGEFARALLSQHATTLEILDLRIVNNRRPLSSATSEQSRESLRKILMGCSELTALSIEGAERMSEYLFLFTWACSPRLHRLFLAASISGDAGGGGSTGLGGGDVVVALQGPGQEAALYGWSVMGNSRPSPRHRRHASGTNINDLEDVDEEEEEGEEEEEEDDHHQEGELADATGSNPTGFITSSDTGLAGDIVHSHQGSSTTPFTTTTTTTSPASPAPNTPALLHTANNSIIPGDEDTPMPIVPLTTSSTSSLSTAGTTSFVRAMMHRLEDMPRLQSFVLNGVEYTRMPSLLVTR